MFKQPQNLGQDMVPVKCPSGLGCHPFKEDGSFVDSLFNISPIVCVDLFMQYTT